MAARGVAPLALWGRRRYGAGLFLAKA